MKRIQGLSRTAVFVALACAFVAVQSVAAAGFLSLLHFRSSTHAVSRAQSVLLELESMLTSLMKAETGQRGYILTGADEFLFPYRASMEATRGHLRRLIDLTQDNAVQQYHISRLVRQIDERIDQLAEPIVARHVDGIHAAGNVVLANHDKRTMDSINRTVAEMREAESRVLQSRSEDSTVWAITAGAFSVVLVLLMFVVFGFSFVVLMLAFGSVREAKSVMVLPNPGPPLG
ncbi:MAG TPA: CHASE3 domain-containing protein [Nitrospiraceae bacterium]|nr:CHASE3 domain-containing protein [Nitrospiraceae bacterium]